MRLFSYLQNGQVRSARLIGQQGIDLFLASRLYLKSHIASKSRQRGILPGDLAELFRSGEDALQFAEDVTDWIIQDSEKRTVYLKTGLLFEVDKTSFVAPIVRPGKVICIAENYPELNKPKLAAYPTVFLKPSGGVIGHHQRIAIPEICKNVAYEVELGSKP